MEMINKYSDQEVDVVPSHADFDFNIFKDMINSILPDFAAPKTRNVENQSIVFVYCVFRYVSLKRRRDMFKRLKQRTYLANFGIDNEHSVEFVISPFKSPKQIYQQPQKQQMINGNWRIVMSVQQAELLAVFHLCQMILSFEEIILTPLVCCVVLKEQIPMVAQLDGVDILTACCKLNSSLINRSHYLPFGDVSYAIAMTYIITSRIAYKHMRKALKQIQKQYGSASINLELTSKLVILLGGDSDNIVEIKSILDGSDELPQM